MWIFIFIFVHRFVDLSKNEGKYLAKNENGLRQADCVVTSALNHFALTGDQRPLIAVLTDADGQFQHSEIKSLKHRISLAMKLKTEPSETSCPLSISSHFEAVQAILSSIRENKAINELKKLKESLSCTCPNTCPNPLNSTTSLNKVKLAEQIPSDDSLSILGNELGNCRKCSKEMDRKNG